MAWELEEGRGFIYIGTSNSEPSIIGTLYNKPLYKDIAQGPKITFP